MKDILSSKGYLYVELPGIFNLEQYSYDFLRNVQNAHNYYFVLGTLEQVLRFYGYELVHGNEKIFSLFRYTGRKDRHSVNYYQRVKSYLVYSEKVRLAKQLMHPTSLELYGEGEKLISGIFESFRRRSNQDVGTTSHV